MNKKRIRYIFSKATLQKLLSYLFVTLGGFWLLIEIIAFFFPEINVKNVSWFYISFVLSFLWAFWQSFPPISYSKKFRNAGVEINIKVKNIFEENSHLALGIADFLDTQDGVISKKSLIAKLVHEYFNDSHNELDARIQNYLVENPIKAEFDAKKDYGKKYRYPIGSVIVVPIREHKVFLTVLARMSGNKYQVSATDNDLWISLKGLWSAVRDQSNLEPIAIPVIGAGLSKVFNYRLSLIQLILISFANTTRVARVTRKLTVVIDEDSYDAAEMTDAIKLLDILRI